MFRFPHKAILLSLCVLVLVGTDESRAQSVPTGPELKSSQAIARRRTVAGPRRGFPNLRRYQILGPSTAADKKTGYNCIAHTLGIHDRWVWPGYRVADFDRLYGAHGYKRSRSRNSHLDRELEKVVLYGKVSQSGRVRCTHAARQRADGTWTSKLGSGPLIRHATPGALNGPSYGKPIAVYVRPRQARP